MKVKRSRLRRRALTVDEAARASAAPRDAASRSTGACYICVESGRGGARDVLVHHNTPGEGRTAVHDRPSLLRDDGLMPSRE